MSDFSEIFDDVVAELEGIIANCGNVYDVSLHLNEYVYHSMEDVTRLISAFESPLVNYKLESHRWRVSAGSVATVESYYFINKNFME